MSRYRPGGRPGILTWAVAICVPIALLGTSVRLILLPAYPQIEYRLPHFPEDPYGFTTEDRIQLSGFAWYYLTHTTASDFLAGPRFGDGSPVFNGREVSHMADVKTVVGWTLWTWVASIAVLAASGLLLWRRGNTEDFRIGLRRGGWLTITIAAFVGGIIVFGMLIEPDVFWQFFSAFHGLFFESDTWLFAYSDTLIRLFPIRFWQDTFLIATLIVLGGGLALGTLTRHRAIMKPPRKPDV